MRSSKKNGTGRANTVEAQPVSALRWVQASELHSNTYNPNTVFAPEMESLRLSLLEDGWTQPIVVRSDMEIVDGFHRWTLGSTDPEIAAMTGGLVPIVTLVHATQASQMVSTVRHNRARGQHGILKMGEIVRTLHDLGLRDAEICEKLGMEEEELERLSDLRGSPEMAGKDSFGQGWIPKGKLLPRVKPAKAVRLRG